METFQTRLRFPYYDYIPKRGLKNLAKYKYHGTDLSLIAKYLLQPFWGWLANYLPEWPAPNLITFAGFVPCFLSFVLTALSCPSLTEVVPRWISILNFICLFVYQTLDALDGKQARRTGTSSPLGELFDHGCDALTTIFVGLSVSCTLGLGQRPLLYALVMCMLVPFYTTQWEEYFTGTLVLGYIGVTEAQMTTLAVYLLAGIFGSEIYTVEIRLFGHIFTPAEMLVCGVFLSTIGHVIYNSTTVFSQWKQGHASAFNAVGYLAPVVSVVISSAVWYYHCPELIVNYPHFFLLMLGLVVANFVGRIIVYRVCALDAAFFPELLLPLFAATLNGVLGNILLPTCTSVYLVLIFYLVAYLHFAVSIINQMTTYLNIRCFVIPVPNLASNPPVKPAGGVPTPDANDVSEVVEPKANTASPKPKGRKSPALSPKATRRNSKN